MLIRHGQTDWNAEHRWQGHSDVPLNQVGVTQATSLAKRLAGRPINAVYSSDLKRAAMTAEILGRSLNLEPILDAAWRERDVGAFAGLTNAQVQAAYPEEWEAMRQGRINPPGGEPYTQLSRRVTRAYERLLVEHYEGEVAVVSHGGALYTLISFILGFGADRIGRFSLNGNTGLSIIEVEEHGPRLTLLNDTCHLDHLNGG
jgi:broad specificity phosphatase PhoE